MSVRLATHEDAGEVLRMARAFLRHAPQGAHVPATDEDIRTAIAWAIDHAAIFLGERDGRVCAMLCARITPLFFAPVIRIANELAWWVDEDARGGMLAVRLVRAYEAWAVANGASTITMSSIEAGQDVGRLLTRLGYTCVERSYIRRI